MEPGGELLYYADGLTATTTVERRGGTIVLKANGKPEASDTVDMPTQILVGLLPFLIRAELDGVVVGDEVAAMIGFGSGVTAGASLQWPLKALDVVEIEATMVEASRFFNHVNHRPLEDPRHLLVESDGRNYLEYVPKTFDVIVSEPSNPWIAGVSALFTEEYFRRVTTRLNDGGVYGQWVQLYELRPENVRRVFATFLSVFPHVHAFSSKAKSTDLILVGSMSPMVFGPESFGIVDELPRVAAELRRAGIEEPAELIGLLFMTERELREFAEGARVNTDDNGLLEFSAPFDLLYAEEGERFFAEFYFQPDDHGDPRPYLAGWPDGPGWTDDARAAVIRGVFLAGKPALARALVADRPAEAEGSALAQIAAVLDVAGRSVGDFAVRPELAAARAELEARRFRRAEQMLDEIAEEAWAGDDTGFLKLYGDALYRRRRYREALGVFEALVQAPTIDSRLE